MFGTIRTLWAGAEARAEERLRQTYAVELIDQKLREAEAGLGQSKRVLASLVLRERGEGRALEALASRRQDLTGRARAALAAGREDLAVQAAEAIAALENESKGRHEVQARLQLRILRLQEAVAAGHRRLADLKQGAVSARAFRDEQGLAGRLKTTLAGPGPMAEAEALIGEVLGRVDAWEEAEVLEGIERGLSGEAAAEALAGAGFGGSLKVTGAEIMARLKTNLDAV